jgi:DNA-binding NarL/FixJ family response regulator
MGAMATADSDIAAHSALGLEGEPAPSRPAGKGVSIVLIERRSLTRQCLSRWLQDGSRDLCVFSVGSPADLLDASRSLSDLHMIIFSIGAASVKDPDVVGRMTLLRRHMSRIPLVLLSDRDDVDEVVEAIEQGVRGYIPTSLEPSEAAAALQCVAAGGTFVPVSAVINVAQDRQNRSTHIGEGEVHAFQRLTPRECEVLARVRQGKPNKIIAHELEITENTVKVFVRRILMKLHASNRTEVACQRSSDLPVSEAILGLADDRRALSSPTSHRRPPA